MRRHFIWFASGIPKALMVRDSFYSISPLDAAAREQMANAAQSEPQIAESFRMAKELVEIVFCNELEDQKEAFEAAVTSVRGILDVYSFLTLNPPALLPVVVAHQEGAEEAVLEMFDFETTAKAHVGEEATKRLYALGLTLLDHLIAVFDVATLTHPKGNTDLGQNIRVAAKMFRHGRRAHDVQVQFLCKFTAVETLVCGSVDGGHGKLLKGRVSSLFRNRVTPERMLELWRLRCGASHQGAGTWLNFAHSLPDVQMIATGCLLFASHHLNRVDTVAELWQEVDRYSLPPEFLQPGNFNAWPIERVFRPLRRLNVAACDWERPFKPAGKNAGPAPQLDGSPPD